MKNSTLLLALGLALVALPAAAADNDLKGIATLFLLYLVYGLVCGCLAGWSMLVLAVARTRVESAYGTLGSRPLASFVMGLLCLGWLLLSLGLAKALGPVGGLLVLFTLSLLTICSLLGLPAVLIGLGQRVWSLWRGPSTSLAKDLLLGGLVLFAAGGLPWLGQLLLIFLLIWSCGAAVLSLAGPGSSRPEADDDGEVRQVLQPD